MTFLIHPEHGATNAGGADIDALKKAGWLVSNHAYWMSLKGKEFKAPKDESDTGAPVVEIKVYEDGTQATGPAPLPEAAPVKNKGGRPRKVV